MIESSSYPAGVIVSGDRCGREGARHAVPEFLLPDWTFDDKCPCLVR